MQWSLPGIIKSSFPGALLERKGKDGPRRNSIPHSPWCFFVLHSQAMCSSQWARTLPQKSSQEQNLTNPIPCLRGHSTCPSDAGSFCLSRYTKPKPASGFFCSQHRFSSLPTFRRIWLFSAEPLSALPVHIHTCLHIVTTKSYLLLVYYLNLFPNTLTLFPYFCWQTGLEFPPLSLCSGP